MSEIRSRTDKGCLHRDDNGTILLVRKQLRPQQRVMINPADAARLLHDEPTRIYVPLIMHPWIMQACHANASCHFGVSRTLSMLEPCYWWTGMNISTQRSLRRALKCQARKTSPQTVRWPILLLPLTSGLGIAVSVD